MRKAAGIVAGIILLGTLAAADPAPRDEPQTRTLTGQVTDKANAPIAGAVVYLQDTRTQTVKTYITSEGGNYRFSSLSPNTDYQVRAEYQGHKSDTKTLSSFDSRSKVVMQLKIKMTK
jgi:protocatechuate 3,4-dioxygenase beta subunit